MGFIASAESYSKKQLEVSKIAKAIAHPARIAILELLNTKDCTCNDIVRVLPIAQSTVSQHLIELKKVELIQGIDLPPRTLYRINKRMYTQSKNLLDSLFRNN